MTALPPDHDQLSPGVPAIPGAPGGDTSNTPPYISHLGSVTIPWTGSEDWMEWSWQVQWNEKWEALRSQLRSARQAAADAATESDASETPTLELGGYPAVISPAGARLGRNGKGPYMPWRVKWQGLILMIADRPEPRGHLPSVVVRADGLACLTARAELLWHRAENLIASLGGDIEVERLSRVDLCLDLPGVAIAPFVDAYESQRFITKAKGHEIRKGKGTTIYIGGATLLARIYDKLAELKRKRDDLKRGLMGFHRWSGAEPDEATRIEFELHRKALTDRGISTVADYFQKRADLADYLCTTWLRFTAGQVDRTHTTRAKNMPLWDAVHAAYLAWTGRPVGEPLEPLPREAYDTDMLGRTMLGLGTTMAVRKGMMFKSEYALLDFIVREVRKAARDSNWRERMRKKAVDYVDLE